MGSPRSAIREWPPLATTREKLVQHRRARTVTHTHTHTHTQKNPVVLKKKSSKNDGIPNTEVSRGVSKDDVGSDSQGVQDWDGVVIVVSI